jgi:hypothetical protein
LSHDRQHRCTVHRKTADGTPFLAFEPSSKTPSSYSHSLFTLDLRAGASVEEAAQLAAQINELLWGVSTIVF